MADAVCTDTEGDFTCACQSGFTGDGLSCTNIDECAENLHACDANATCSDTAGGYECTCNAGYGGDGFSCEEE